MHSLYLAMRKPIITGLMAYGTSGKIFHAPFISGHRGFTFKAVAERNQKRVNKDYPDVISYDSVADLLEDKELELVIVNTPNNTHFDYAKQALLAGKHVLIEKPAATSSKEIRELFGLGKSVNKQMLVYQNRRWSSDFLSAKKVIESGELGQIIEVHLRFDRYRNAIGTKLFKETPIPGSGILYDLGSHLIDQAISVFGKPLSYTKTTGIYRPGSEVDDYTNLHLRYPHQLNVFITVSMLVADPQPGIIIHGTKGSFIKSFCDTQEEQLMAGLKPGDDRFGKEKDGMDGSLTIIHEDGIKETKHLSSQTGRYMDLFEAVYQTIRNGKKFPVKQDEIIVQLEMLEH
jgi:scyllo-inositol 2-dehydrogenase (NADP+)